MDETGPAAPVQQPQTEKEQWEARKAELVNMRAWMMTNKILDIGRLEVELSQIEVRLKQLS